jgi:hypothetical protein
MKAAEKVLSDNQQSKGYFFSESLKTKVQKKISVVEQEATEYSVAHPDGELVWTKISTDTMQAPFQKNDAALRPSSHDGWNFCADGESKAISSCQLDMLGRLKLILPVCKATWLEGKRRGKHILVHLHRCFH